jgi:hypothetical protein
MKHLLIGDNSFIGVNHLSQSKARETISELTISKMADVVNEAILNGAEGFAFSTHPTNEKILRTLREKNLPKQPFNIYPLLPYAEGYVRLANQVGMGGIFQHFISDLSLIGKVKMLLKGGISALTFDPIRFLKFYVDVEVDRYLRIKPKNAVLGSVLLHEVVTDLALAFGLTDLLSEYDKHIRRRYNVKPGYATRNFARFVKFFRESNLPLENIIIMAPFNKIGFQMPPSREECEKALSSLRMPDVLAVSLLAGGLLTLDDATEYLQSLPNLSGAVVGVSSIQHAQATFQKLRGLLHDEPTRT